MSETTPHTPTEAKVKPATPLATGFVIGLCILAFFYLVAKLMGLPTFVEHWNIPMQ